MSTNLPPTAYVKLIDCWLIFSLLKPFMDIIVQTYIHRQTQKENSGKEINAKQVWTKKQKTNMKMKIGQTFVRVVYPVFFLVFIIIFWIVGLIHYINL